MTTGKFDPSEWRAVTAAEDVTKEILDQAEEVFNGWYANESRVDWDDFLYRLDGMDLADGKKLDLTSDMMTPAVKAIKKHIGEYRKL